MKRMGSCAESVPSSILEHLVLAKGTFVFLSDVETYQSASKALFVAPRYSDFFLCFIHIFLSKLGVPYRLPPVSGREASAPGVMFKSYSAIFLKRCLRLANKAQEAGIKHLSPWLVPIFTMINHWNPMVITVPVTLSQWVQMSPRSTPELTVYWWDAFTLWSNCSLITF